MDWFAPIDAYCERLGPGLWAEPLNALSNLGFVVAALWAATQAWKYRAGLAVWILVVLVLVIGVGSGLFHTFANRLAAMADVIPITLFIYFYLAFALRCFARSSWIAVVIWLAGLFLVTLFMQNVTEPGFMNGSGAYVPALIASVAVSLLLRRRGHEAAHHLILASSILFISLIFRTADQIACPVLPIGTHFIWHLLNAVVLALYLEAAIRFAPNGSGVR
jgi:ceramidase